MANLKQEMHLRQEIRSVENDIRVNGVEVSNEPPGLASAISSDLCCHVVFIVPAEGIPFAITAEAALAMAATMQTLVRDLRQNHPLPSCNARHERGH